MNSIILNALLAVIVIANVVFTSTLVNYDEARLSEEIQNLPLDAKIALLNYFQNVLGLNKADNKCCQIDPPSIPIFSNTGHLLFYQQTDCPPSYTICCKGYINLLGTCLSLEQASSLLPVWQDMVVSQGITLAQAIQQSGVVG